MVFDHPRLLVKMGHSLTRSSTLLGESGLDGTDLLPNPSQPPITNENPILAMRNALLAHPKGTSWVIATGTLTNVALLFSTFPEVADHIQGLSIMGGAIGGGFTNAPMSRIPGEKSRIGNVTPWAEFNLYVRTSLRSDYPSSS